MSLYLSEIRLDPLDARTARTLSCLYRLHEGVMSGFDRDTQGDQRVLFRYESPRLRPPTLLIQSTLEPDWSRGLDQFFRGADTSVKGRCPRLTEGRRYRFRLRANPTVKKRPDDRKHGKREGIYGEERLLQWLRRKLEGKEGSAGIGARLLGAQVVDEGLLFGWREGKRLEFQSALFDGVLVAGDPVLLHQAVLEGIGSAKGFGFGLLSLAPAG